MKHRQSSLLRLILSMFIFGTIGVFRRSLPVSSAFLAMFRGLVGSLFLLLMLMVQKKKPDLRGLGQKWLPLIASGGLIGLNWILLFESYRYTSVAISTLCYYMSPVFVMIASPLILHERLEKRKVISLVLSLAGMLMVSGLFSSDSSDPGRLAGVLLGLGAAVLYASVVLINQTLKTVPSYERTIVQLFCAGLIVMPYTLMTEGLSDFSCLRDSWFMLLVIALVHTALAYVLYFSSMNGLNAQTIAVISYLDPLTAVLLSVFFLNEPMDGWGIAGTVLILFAAVFAEIHTSSKNNQQEESHA